MSACPDHSSYLIGRFRASWYQSVARTADRLSESQARVAELLDRLGSQDREREEAYRPEAAPSFDVDPRVVDAIARVNDRVDHLASDLYAPERGLKDRVDALEQSRESIKRGLQAISNRVFPPTAPRGEEG